MNIGQSMSEANLAIKGNYLPVYVQVLISLMRT